MNQFREDETIAFYTCVCVEIPAGCFALAPEADRERAARL